MSPRRPVSSICWGPAGDKLALAYCNLEFLAMHPDTPKESHIFDIEDPTRPLVSLEPPYHAVCLEYNPRDGNLVAGGCYNGQVGTFGGFLTIFSSVRN